MSATPLQIEWHDTLDELIEHVRAATTRFDSNPADWPQHVINLREVLGRLDQLAASVADHSLPGDDD